MSTSPTRLKKTQQENALIESIENKSPLDTLYSLAALYAQNAVEASALCRRENTSENRKEKLEALKQVQSITADILKLQEKDKKSEDGNSGSDFFASLPTL